MHAYDLGTPVLYSTNYTVILHVLRNYYAPEFLNSPYVFRVPPTTALDKIVGSVQVRDRDTVYPFNVWLLEAIGDEAATSYFGLSHNGSVYVKNSLQAAPNDEYL